MTLPLQFNIALVALTILVSSAQVKAVIIADSVAEFSGVQGQDNWYYGYYDRTTDADHSYQATDFALMSQFLTTPSMDYGPSLHVPCWRVQDRDYWTALWAEGGHPNGLNQNAGHLPFEHWAIRRWVSEISGVIQISGLVGCSDGFACNINARILVNGAQVDTYSVLNGQVPTNYSVPVPVIAGSFVDFAIDSSGVDFNDMTYFTASITPEPTALALWGIALVLIRRRTRSARYGNLAQAQGLLAGSSPGRSHVGIR